MKTLIKSFVALALIAPQVATAASIDISPDKVVTTLPAGAESSNYLCDATLFRQWGSDNIKTEPTQASLSTIAEAGDKVYIGHLLDGVTEGYVVGTKVGNTVTVALPQVVLNGEEYLAIMCMEPKTVQETVEGYTYNRLTYVISEGPQEIVYSFENGKITQSNSAEFGFVNAEGTWNGYGETGQTYTPFNGELVVAPADAEDFQLALQYKEPMDVRGNPYLYKILTARKKGNEIYIQGLSYQYPESWIKGTIDNDKVTFESGQFLGIGNYSIEYFSAGIDTPEFIPGYNVWNHNISLTPQLVLSYDSERLSMSSLDPNDCFVTNSSPTEYAGGDALLDCTLWRQPSTPNPTPIMPLFTIGVNNWDNGMEPELSFQILPLNIYGQVLDQNNIGFEISVEGEPYSFDAWTYWMDEDMTIIPWGFQSAFINMNYNGFTVVQFQNEHYMRNVLVRTTYRDGDQVYYSDPQNPLDPQVQEPIPDPNSGVKKVSVSEAPIISSRYIDLKGNYVANPVKGIYIRENRHEDGSISREKVII